MFSPVLQPSRAPIDRYSAGMPSYLHELLLALMRNRSESAADLLRELDVQLPEYDTISTESSELNDLKPAEYRADLVLFLTRESKKELGIIVEVQLGRDDDKPYTWPVYIASLRDRHRCPVCVLVITIEEAVARWAGRPIKLGPGTHCTPWVIGPSNTPAVIGLQSATQNVELAVLSAIQHRKDPDIPLASRIASAAAVASAALDSERSWQYLDLLLLSLSQNAPKAFEATMTSQKYQYRSEFVLRYFGFAKAEGLTEGRMEGRLEIILKQLTLKFGPLPDEIQTRVRGAQEAQLNILAERMLTAQTLEEALGSQF